MQQTRFGAVFERGGEHLQERVAIDLCAVRVVKPARLAGQKLQLGRAAALGFPVHAGEGTGPGFVGKHRPTRLHKGSVKGGVVRHDHVGRAHQRLDLRIVDALAAHVVVGDAGDLGDLRGDGFAGVFKRLKHRDRPHRQARGRVHQDREHGQLDDALLAAVQTGRLGVEHQHTLRLRARGHGPVVQARHQAAQDLEVGVGLQGRGHGLGAQGAGGCVFLGFDCLSRKLWGWCRVKAKVELVAGAHGKAVV